MRLNKVFGRQLIVAASAIGLLSAAPAWAGFAQGNTVTMGGQPVFSIAGSADGYSPDHRAWLTQDALDNSLVLANNKSASAVTTARANGAMVVMLDGHIVATADANSASLEGMSPQALADKWADGIRSFLSDGNRTVAYVSELTGKNPISAQVAVLERRIYAPPGTVLPVAFATALNSETLIAGSKIEGRLIQDVAIGRFVMPGGSSVLGVVVEDTPGNFGVAFTTLRTPNGTLLPITANLAGPLSGGGIGPHPVATEDLPYDVRLVYQGSRESVCRQSATVGIGTLGGGPGERLVLRRGTNLVIAPSTPMAIVFDSPTQVAVVLPGTAM